MPPTQTPLRPIVADAPELVSDIDDFAFNAAPLRPPPAPAAPAAVEDASDPDPFYGWVALWDTDECTSPHCDEPTNELFWDVDEDGTIVVHASLGCRFTQDLETRDVEAAAAMITDLAVVVGELSAPLTEEANRLRAAVALLDTP